MASSQRDAACWIVVVAVLTASCSTQSKQAPATERDTPSSSSQSSDAHVGRPNELVFSEFQEIARKLRQGSNGYLGTAQIQVIESRLAQASLSERKIELLLQLSFHQLRLGNVDGAEQSIESAFELTTAPTIPMLRSKTLLHLRQAEVANCVNRHHRQCCIFPLAGGGTHDDRMPALQAKAALFEILARQPNDLPAQWLLNVVAMALAEYPDGVPEQYRIPPSALESKEKTGEFVDIAPQHGIDQLSLCGGVAVEDFNGDGILDFVTSSSDPDQSLDLHLGHANGFQNATAGSGLEFQLGGLNLLASDYDNDGDSDLFVLRGAWLEADGEIRNSLLRNDGTDEQGKLVFKDVTHTAGMAEHAYPTQAAAWGDFNNDGLLDLYVVNESLKEVTNGKRGDYPCQLFLNRGSGKFEEMAKSAGVVNDRFAKGVTAGDYDNDGDLDLYVSNVGKNRLYRNDGLSNKGVPKFTDVAEELGVGSPNGYSFAPWFFDFNNDGWLDIWVSAYRANTADLLSDMRGRAHRADTPRLYLNRGDGTFKNVASSAGLTHPYLPMGANFGDLDNDGWLDVYLATGDPKYETLMPNVVLKNDGGLRFIDITFGSRLGHLQKGHGVAFADFDNDGDQDIFNQLGGFYPGDKFQNALFLNGGSSNRHLSIQLVGKETNRAGLGCRINLRATSPSGTRNISRAVGSVSSFGGSPLGRVEVGLGRTESIAELDVFWPVSKKRQRLTDVPLNSMIRVHENQDRFEVIHRPSVTLSDSKR